MADWARSVAAAYTGGQSDALAKLFDVQNPLVLALANELKAGTVVDKALAPLKTLSQMPEYAAFRKFCQAFVTFMRDATLEDPEKAYELLEAASQPAQLVLRDAAKPTFAPTVRAYVVLLLELAIAADGIAPDRFETEDTDKKQKAVSSRCFNLIGASSEGLDEDLALRKAALILFLTVTLYRIFFSIQADIQQFISIETRLRGVKGFSAVLNQLPIPERCHLAYYEGRAALLQRQLGKAQTRFEEAIKIRMNMPAFRPDFETDLTYYTLVAAVCTGRWEHIMRYLSGTADANFGALYEAITAGDYQQCETVLRSDMQTHLSHETYFLLREKTEVLCWRSLIRAQAKALSSRQDAQPVVPFSDIATAAQRSFNAGDIDEADAECIAASLCEQKMIRGYCAHSRGLLVLAKGEAFPEIVLPA